MASVDFLSADFDRITAEAVQWLTWRRHGKVKTQKLSSSQKFSQYKFFVTENDIILTSREHFVEVYTYFGELRGTAGGND